MLLRTNERNVFSKNKTRQVDTEASSKTNRGTLLLLYFLYQILIGGPLFLHCLVQVSPSVCCGFTARRTVLSMFV